MRPTTPSTPPPAPPPTSPPALSRSAPPASTRSTTATPPRRPSHLLRHPLRRPGRWGQPHPGLHRGQLHRQERRHRQDRERLRHQPFRRRCGQLHLQHHRQHHRRRHRPRSHGQRHRRQQGPRRQPLHDALPTSSVTLSDDRVAGDSLTLGYTAASFADKNVGTGKTVSVSGISLSGADAANYTFNTTASTTADITARALTVSAIGVNKVHDGNPSTTPFPPPPSPSPTTG